MSSQSEDKDFIKHHLPYPCKFCGRGASYAPLFELEKFEVDVYFCHFCQAEFVVGKDIGFFGSVSIYTEISGRMFRFTYNSDNSATIWFIGEPGVPGKRTNKNLKPIKNFSIAPDVTPFNITEKLRTWLLFI